MIFWRKLGTINKATAVPVVTFGVWLVDKLAKQNLSTDEQAIAIGGITAVVVWLVPNKEKAK